jgi:hypothetical protein
MRVLDSALGTTRKLPPARCDARSILAPRRVAWILERPPASTDSARSRDAIRAPVAELLDRMAASLSAVYNVLASSSPYAD